MKSLAARSREFQIDPDGKIPKGTQTELELGGLEGTLYVASSEYSGTDVAGVLGHFLATNPAKLRRLNSGAEGTIYDFGGHAIKDLDGPAAAHNNPVNTLRAHRILEEGLEGKDSVIGDYDFRGLKMYGLLVPRSGPGLVVMERVPEVRHRPWDKKLPPMEQRIELLHGALGSYGLEPHHVQLDEKGNGDNIMIERKPKAGVHGSAVKHDISATADFPEF